ncbi:MAG TPA: hypothetical protein VJN18_23820 [Polyangiaceae bacterium]|nr:hypothetical protein [Polyangiaceae bacterium]
MTRLPVTIELSSPNVLPMKALARILLDRRLRVRVRAPSDRDALPDRGVLRVLPASFIEPALSLLWGGDSDHYDARDHELGLSPAVWTSGWDRWLHQADTPRALRGIPDYSKPWVLVGPSVPGSVDSVRARVGIPGAQLHFLSATGRAPEDSVAWLPTARAARFVLSRVEAVVARRGALAFDGERSGLPVVVEGTAGSGADQTWALAACHVVPKAVQDDPRFWSGVADRLAGAGRASGWGTRSWVLQSRDSVRSQSGLTRWARKLEKWRRDPVAFWRDSLLHRWLG